MKTYRRSASIVGLLFLTAMVTSLLGGIWLETFLADPDYLTVLAANENQVLIGVLLELVNAAAVVGIAVVIYPLLKKFDEALAMGYMGFRVLEAVILVGAVVSPLSLVTLSQEYLAAGSPDASYFMASGSLLLAERASITGLLVPIFFSLGALIFYTLLYRSVLVPRFISIWGFIAVAAVFTWNLLEAFGFHISVGIVFGLPIILNEIFLGIWLIAKGFNLSAMAPEAPGPGSPELEFARLK